MSAHVILPELPKDISGYQALEFDIIVRDDDLVVYNGVPMHYIANQGFRGVIVQHAIDFFGGNIYRKLSTPKNHCNGIKPVVAFIPQEDEKRKQAPMYEGLLGYFPAALFEVATHSFESDAKHNPGSVGGPTWARNKSKDHASCIVRHLCDSGTKGTPNRKYHLRALAWRALALLQEECEGEGAHPGVSSRY